MNPQPSGPPSVAPCDRGDLASVISRPTVSTAPGVMRGRAACSKWPAVSDALGLHADRRYQDEVREGSRSGRYALDPSKASRAAADQDGSDSRDCGGPGRLRNRVARRW